MKLIDTGLRIAKRVIPKIKNKNAEAVFNDTAVTSAVGNCTPRIPNTGNILGEYSLMRSRPRRLTEKDIAGLRLAPNTKGVSQYTLPNGKSVRVYEITPEDKGFLDRLCENSEHYMDTQAIASREVNDKRLIIETAFNSMKEVLEKFPRGAKTHMYIAESDSKLCGALVGGLPKKTPNGEIIYSSRKKAKLDETELNWFATWPEGNGVGKVLFSEYINTMKKDGFNRMFIQSEIPKLSGASKFYQRMGFDKIHKFFTERRVSKVEYNKDTLDCLNIESSGNELYDYLIVPMLGVKNKLDGLVKSIFQNCKRERFVASVDANNFIKELNH